MLPDLHHRRRAEPAGVQHPWPRHRHAEPAHPAMGRHLAVELGGGRIVRVEDHHRMQPARIPGGGIDDVAVVVAIDVAALHQAGPGHLLRVHHLDEGFDGDRIVRARGDRQAGVQGARLVSIPIVRNQMRVGVEKRLELRHTSYPSGTFDRSPRPMARLYLCFSRAGIDRLAQKGATVCQETNNCPVAGTAARLRRRAGPRARRGGTRAARRRTAHGSSG